MSFVFEMVGFKEIFLVVDILKILVSGIVFDVCVFLFFWFEGFDGLSDDDLF